MDYKEIFRSWKYDPIQFVRDNFKAEPDAWQRKALEAYISNDRSKTRISLQACAGPGKSACLAWIGWHFLACFGDDEDHPKAACVSITWDTLRDTLWTELSKWQQKSPFLSGMFTWTQTKIFNKQFPSTWFMSARSFPKGADQETIGKTLSGLHSKYLLYLLDESGAIPPAILKTVNQGLGETLARKDSFCCAIQAGNPLTTDGCLYEASKSDQWHTIRITGDPEDPDRSPRIDLEYAKEMIATYGRDNPWVESYILGRFPSSGINTLLTIDEVEDAMNRHLSEDQYKYAQKRLGVDVAREGLDKTIIFPRQGLASFNYVEMAKANGPEVASRVIMSKKKWGSEVEFIDDTGGFGASVIDYMILQGFTPQGIHFSQKATNPKYYNKRAEIWYEMAEWIKRGGALPKCEKLKKELTAPTYSFKQGRLILEDKEQIKKRLGFSPDIADALALTFSVVDMPAQDEFHYIRRMAEEQDQEDYDPFSVMHKGNKW